NLLAKTARLGYLIEIREGGLQALADEGEFDVLADQARRLPELTGEASDHYVAAGSLAYGAKAAAESEQVAAEQREAIANRLAAEAVQQLESAWMKGYLRRSGGFANLLSARPTLKS